MFIIILALLAVPLIYFMIVCKDNIDKENNYKE